MTSAEMKVNARSGLPLITSRERWCAWGGGGVEGEEREWRGR